MNKREYSFPEPMPEYRVPRVAAQQRREREQAEHDAMHPQIFDDAPTPDPTEFAPEPDWRAIAAKRYPRSAKLGRIKGTGSLVLECARLTVFLFSSAAARDEKEEYIYRHGGSTKRAILEALR